MPIRQLAILVFLLLPGLFTRSQPYYFRHYQVENGLSNNAVICSLQDKKGFLWFGTKDGLDRFDGYSFKVFRNDPNDSGSIGSNFIHCLYEDPAGILWVGTENGLYRHDPTTESFRPLGVANSGRIRSIQMDRAGNLWFISGFTLFRYDLVKKTLNYYNADRYFGATSICLASDSSLWVSTTEGSLQRYDPQRNVFIAHDLFMHSPRTLNTWIETIYAGTDGVILAGTSIHGAKLFDIHTGDYKDILTYNSDGTAVFARNFIQTTPDGSEFWIATESGVFIYDKTTGHLLNLPKKYNDPYSLSDNAVYTFCKDKEGGIWAGTYFGGINYYPKPYTSFKKYFPKSGENSLSGYVVREIHPDRYGRLWIGTEDAGLNRLDTATGLFTHFQPTGTPGSISYSNIHGLLVRGDELWIGTFEHGLDIMDVRTGRVIRHYSSGSGPYDLKSNFIYCIYQTKEGAVWVGTTRGAYQYDPVHKGFVLLPGMPLNNWYSSLLEDKQGVIWAGTYGNGVNYYDPHTKTSGNYRYDPRNKNSLSSDRVNSLFEDGDRNLWFATEGGLCRLNADRRSYRRYTTADGFPSDYILTVLEDGKKDLWISTSKGLVCLDPRSGQVNTYTRANGLLNDQFNFSSAYKDPAGMMYFGSVKGMISFNPAAFARNSFIPPVYITGFQVDNEDLPVAREGAILKKSISYTDKIVLDYYQSTFSIDFAALSYTAPEMAEYAYKMEGLDKDWTYLKRNRKAYFTGLAPGNYIFKVKASNSSGLWNGQETRLSIQVLPPWWASPWAYGVYILVGISILAYFIRNYHNRVEEKNRQKIEHLEAAKEKEILNAKIEFFTNVAHEIKTPLTLIRGPLEKVMKRAGPDIQDNLRIMERNTNRLIDLTNQLLDFRQTEIRGFSLNFVKANITELLEEMHANFRPLAETRNLWYGLDLPADRLFAYVDTDAFLKILANLFSNAVKYAGKEVHIRLLPFTTGDVCFTIVIRNDGYLIPGDMKEKIFEPFFRLKGTEKQKGTGIGLALSRSLTQLHKGTLELRPADETTGVQGSAEAGQRPAEGGRGPAGGGYNVFVLTLPIHQNNEFNLYLRSKTIPTNEPNDIIGR